MKNALKKLLKKSKIAVKIKRNFFTKDNKINSINYKTIPYFKNNSDFKIVVDSNSKKIEKYGLICKKDCEDKNLEVIESIDEVKDNEKAYYLKKFKCSNKNLLAVKEYIIKNRNTNKIVLVGHSGGQGGAEVLLENIIKEMVKQGNEIVVISRGNGPIIEKYKQYAPTYVVDTYDKTLKAIEVFKNMGYRKVILNTVVNGDLISHFKENNYEVVTLVHELPGVIKILGCEDRANMIANSSDYVVFPSNYVLNKFEELQKVNVPKFIKPQGLFMIKSYEDRGKVREEFRSENNIAKDNLIVMNAGVGEYRKGFDIFLEVAKRMKNEKITFIWVGSIKDEYVKEVNLPNLITPGYMKSKDAFTKFYAVSDLFLLTSREDPFPSVVLEAFNAELPVIGFKNAGGFQDVVKDGISGYLIDYEDIDQIIEKISFLNRNRKDLEKMGKEAKRIVKDYSFEEYIKYLTNLFAKEK